MPCAGGVDVEMEFGMRRAQLAQPREQPLRGEQRQDAEPQPQQLGTRLVIASTASDNWSSTGAICAEQALAVGVEDHRLVAALEQRLADEALQRLDAAAERGGRQREFLGGGLDRAEPRDLDEGLDRARGGSLRIEPLSA